MIVLFATIVQYGLLLGGSFFLFWYSMISIRYQNKQCASLNITQFAFNNTDSSLIDSRLKLNHFTILGTHNSYHRANLFYKYEHDTLDKQFSYNIRQVELDVHLMPDNILVYHIQLFDERTNCYCFKACLMLIVQWIEKNPSHYPIYLFIEIKQMFYEDLVVGLTGGVTCDRLEEIKDEILEVFSSNIFIPAKQIQGNQTTLSLAFKQQRQDELSGDYTYHNYGWPSVSQSLGKIIPVFLDDVHNRAVDLYSTCDSLQNFFLIAQSNVHLPYSSIICVSDPIKDEQILENSASSGQILRLYLGYGSNNLENTYQTTKQYGIHIISSDSEHCTNTPLCQALVRDFQNSPVLCNSYFAPSFCNSSMSFF